MVQPLLQGATYRRGVYLLLGAVLLLPYLLLGAAFIQELRDAHRPPWITLTLALVTAGVALVPAFLSGTRALEISTVRLFLGVDLPDPPPVAASAGRAGRETQLRAALWFAVHLAVGGTVGAVLMVALPLALTFVAARLDPFAPVLTGLGLTDLDTAGTILLTVIGLLVLAAIGYTIAGLGALAAMMAPVLLGPSAMERITALEVDARRSAERHRVARELHDSLGHALTVTVLQAGAAGQLLDRDPEFARRALAAIEEIGRTAMQDLDQALGALRAEPVGAAGLGRSLADLPRAVSEARAAGRSVDLDTRGSLETVPAALSGEGYRIAQEGLTNALRHAGAAPVSLSVAVDGTLVSLEVSNPLPDDPVEIGGGSGLGLTGMRERVSLLGGSLIAGPDGDRWRVRVELRW